MSQGHQLRCKMNIPFSSNRYSCGRTSQGLSARRVSLNTVVIPAIWLCLSSPVYGATERWCSDGYEAPAEMTFSFDTNVRMHLRIGDQTETFMAGNKMGAGLNGTGYISHRTGKSETLLKDKIVMGTKVDPPDEPEIYIFRDRVFWPCEHHHDNR